MGLSNLLGCVILCWYGWIFANLPDFWVKWNLTLNIAKMQWRKFKTGKQKKKEVNALYYLQKLRTHGHLERIFYEQFLVPVTLQQTFSQLRGQLCSFLWHRPIEEMYSTELTESTKMVLARTKITWIAEHTGNRNYSNFPFLAWRIAVIRVMALWVEISSVQEQDFRVWHSHTGA